MRALSIAAAAALLTLAGGLSLAQEMAKPDSDPIVTLGGQTRLIYPTFPTELLITEDESHGQFGMVVVYEKPNEGPQDLALMEYNVARQPSCPVPTATLSGFEAAGGWRLV